MSDIFDKSVRDFLNVTASDAPTPGGGSVAALCGAQAAALVQMVGRLTVGKQKYRQVEEEVKQLIDKGNRLMEKLKRLALDDMAHFDAFMEVLRLPKENEEQQKYRKERMQGALINATGTPLAIAAAGVEVLSLACRLAEIGTKLAVSDTGVAAHLAEAAVQSALITAESNIGGIEDRAFVEQFKAEKARLSDQAAHLKEKTLEFMNRRMI
ncbi:cyclodeaminase/cyclohydrolase family protein [Desulfofalx alkaliphila]|uniref:cyclodeaminase/cyclohydrolase family protein n=1 Tax=Desulfofalx alkaliphila TaxID=105483 RepID=UPI0004E19093|nr:cyclodeaminase/cyclohydrolase family protein [Desulfofalx alkaliphila]